MHPSHKTRHLPDHVVFLGAFAALAAAVAYALYARPDAERPALLERPAAERPAVETSTSNATQHWMLGIREIGPNESTPVTSVDSAAAPTPGELIVAEAPQAATVTRVGAPRHRSRAQRRSYAHDGTLPSGAGGARSLASLPPPGD